MFDDPRDDSSFVEDGKYVAKVAGLEQTEPSPAHPEWGPGIKWKFNLQEYGQTTPLYDQDGKLYEYWAFTSSKLTPRAQARGYVEALLNRQLTPDDKGAALADELIGKKAIIMIGPKRLENGTIRYGAILSMSPYTEPNGKGKAPATPAEPTPEAVAF